MTPSIGKDYCVSSHWLLAALYLLISPLAFAHYPESDKQHVKTVAPLSLSKAQSKLQVDDLLVTAERYSARENRINLFSGSLLQFDTEGIGHFLEGVCGSVFGDWPHCWIDHDANRSWYRSDYFDG